MSLHMNEKDRRPVETSHFGDALKHISRLYPSLPNMDSHNFRAVESPTGENHPTTTEFHPDGLQGDTQPGDSPPCSDVHLKAQIHFLQEQRTQLLSINEKWAKEYKTMVKFYKEKIQVLKASQQHEEDKCGKKQTTSQRKQQAKLVKEDDNSRAGGSEVTADAEAAALRSQNSCLTRRGQHQQAEIQRLNKALQEALQSSQPVGGSSETQQNIWTHQAEVYKEDFFRERKDREKLKGKYLELEKKFRKVYDELRMLKSQVTLVLQPQPPCPCTGRPKSPNWEAVKASQQHGQSQRRLSVKH